MLHESRAHHHNAEMEECIRNCSDCHNICVETISYCLQKGGQHAVYRHIRLLQDCAQVCQTSADFMLRGSDLHKYTCDVCAEICKRCAEDCERMVMGNDEQMHVCAEVCRSCAESCHRMAEVVT